MDAGLATPVPLALPPLGLALGVAVTWGLLLWLSCAKCAGRGCSCVLRVGGLAGRRPVGLPVIDRLAWLWGRAVRSIPLVCALSITLLCLLALAELRPGLLSGSARSTLILLDASLSMQAIDGAPTRFAHAQRMAAELIDARAGQDVLQIAQLDSDVSPLSGWSRDRERLHAALDRARAGSSVRDLSAAAGFVRDSLRGRASPELIWISDGASGASAAALDALRAAGIGVRWLPVGRSEQRRDRRFAVRPWA